MKETPRRAYSKQLKELDELLANLTMNYEPLTISVLKKEFESHDGELELEEFILTMKQHLVNWKPTLPDRDDVILRVLVQLFKEIDLNGNGSLDWDEFTSYIIEQAVVYGSPNDNNIESIKEYSYNTTLEPYTPKSRISQIVNMDTTEYYGILEANSSQIHLLLQETGQEIGSGLQVTNEGKRLRLKDKTMYKISKPSIIRNALFLNGKNILLTATDDCMIRAWEINGGKFYSVNYEYGYPLLCANNPQCTLE